MPLSIEQEADLVVKRLTEFTASTSISTFDGAAGFKAPLKKTDKPKVTDKKRKLWPGRHKV